MTARRHRNWQLSSRRGHGTGRPLVELRVPAHRATTRTLQALYPFVIDSSLGTRGVYVGRQTGSDS